MGSLANSQGTRDPPDSWVRPANLNWNKGGMEEKVLREVRIAPTVGRGAGYVGLWGAAAL